MSPGALRRGTWLNDGDVNRKMVGELLEIRIWRCLPCLYMTPL